MSLEQFSLGASVTWEMRRAVSGFEDVVQGPETKSFSLAGLSTTTWNAVFAARYTILAAGTQAVDLRSYTDLPGNSITATKALSLLILVEGATTGSLNVKKHGTDGLQWFFENASYGINIPGGGMNLFSAAPTAAGTTVDASNRQLLLTNNGAGSLTVTVVVLESTV